MLGSSLVLWYVTRGTGAVALLLLTASVALGVVSAVGWRSHRWPRFTLNVIHRNLTLAAIAFVALHVVTTVLDAYAPISFVSTVVPFTSSYRPLWLGFGAVAFDLLLALTISSLARRWIPARAWRVLHWSAYAAWPVALLHALGTGSDARAGWLAALGVGSLALVALAAVVRALGARDVAVRAAGVAAALAVPIAIIAWYQSGPLQHGWARRAGTPARLLASSRAPAAKTKTRASTTPTAPTSFVSALSGRLSRTSRSDGLVTIHLVLRLRGGPRGAARIDLQGIPGDEGVSMTASGVSFVPATTRAVYTGSVVALEGNRVVADVRDAAGSALRLGFRLQIDTANQTVSGVAVAST